MARFKGDLVRLAEGAARMAGAEDINFTVFGSGKRADTVIGRPTEKVIADHPAVRERVDAIRAQRAAWAAQAAAAAAAQKAKKKPAAKKA